MKRAQTTIEAHTTRESQVVRSRKSQNLALGQIFLRHSFFSFHRYFIETTTTDIHMLLQV